MSTQFTPNAGGTGLSCHDGCAARRCWSIPSGYADCAPVSTSTNDHVLRSHVRTSNDCGELAATPQFAPGVALVVLAHERPDRLFSPRFAAEARLSEALLAGGSCRGSDQPDWRPVGRTRWPAPSLRLLRRFDASDEPARFGARRLDEQGSRAQIHRLPVIPLSSVLPCRAMRRPTLRQWSRPTRSGSRWPSAAVERYAGT